MSKSIKILEEKEIQVLWQTGKNYYEQYKNLNSGKVKIYDFIEDMNLAYSACDLLLARAGATTLAELLNLGIPSILVPSPNVAENHQYYNAKTLSDNEAAVFIEDKDLRINLVETVLEVINSEKKLSELKNKALEFAKPDAAQIIAQNAIKFAEVL